MPADVTEIRNTTSLFKTYLFVNSSVHLDLKITTFISHPKNMLVFFFC